MRAITYETAVEALPEFYDEGAATHGSGSRGQSAAGMNQRDEFAFSGLGCLYAVWRWLPIALVGLGFWLVREDWAGAVPLGLVSLVAGFAWLASEFGARRRR